MNTKEKIYAIEDLAEAKVSIRLVDDQWLVSVPNLEIKHGGILKSPCGRGLYIDDAVNRLWNELTNLTDDEWLVRDAWRSTRAAYRWSGFMWKRVSE